MEKVAMKQGEILCVCWLVFFFSGEPRLDAVRAGQDFILLVAPLSLYVS